jgi:hypothetical protein
MNRSYLFYLIVWLALVNSGAQGQKNIQMNVRVDVQSVMHQMKGGIGASWHAMVKEIPLENEKYEFPVRMVNPRGSGYAGNPPFSDTSAWNQLYKHAKWLGLDFIRVELSQIMYEPERKVFDWNNEEMQTLYRILDWCEANHADVFLQQMWGHVAWNSYPGVQPLLSAPKSLDDFADGITTLLEYLTNTRKYACIKYFCMTNEPPGGPWGYWWSSGSIKGNSITEAWKKLHQTFLLRGIRIPISGPDWTSLPPFDTAKIDFDSYIGSYDIHSYNGIYNKGEKIITDWVNWAHSHDKPLFLSELGNMTLGWGTSNQGPKSFSAALSNASDVILCMNLGVDGFNRWSFTNRGDMDGQWQLVKTYDLIKKTYTQIIIPENEAYYGFAMLSRFLGKYASILSCKTAQKIDGVLITACKNRDGNISLLLVNNKKESVLMNITMDNLNKKIPFYFYQVTETLLIDPAFELNAKKILNHLLKVRTIELLPESISVLSTLNLTQKDFGVIE